MAIHHRLTTAQGRPVLVKQADTASDIAHLVHEAGMLRAAGHPGVVAVVDERDVDGGGHELHLAVAGTRTVADLRADVIGVAGLLAALAATVADLHELGIVHGRIRAEHVVVDGTGRPVLCGFGGAARIGQVPLGGAVPLTPADDVAGLGSLLAHLLAVPLDDASSARRVPWRQAPRAHGPRRSLLAIAEQARADDPARRPTARALSASIVAVMPAARLPFLERAHLDDRPVPNSDHRRRPTLRRIGAPLAGAVGLGLLSFGVGGLLRPPAAGRPVAQARPPVPTIEPTVTSTTSPTTAPTTDEAAAPATTAVAAPVVEIAPGVVAVDGVRYGVGRPGDLLAVGDWDCDGTDTVAVVRPGTGEVFVFEGWAVEGRDAVAAIATTVPGAASVTSADHDGDGCPTLVVADAGGLRTEVAV